MHTRRESLIKFADSIGSEDENAGIIFQNPEKYYVS